MKAFLGNVFITLLVSFAVTVAALNWIVNDNVTKSFLSSGSIESNIDGINKIDVRIRNKEINVDVHISRPFTCKELIDALGIDDLKINHLSMAAVCTTVNKKLVRITYVEVTKI